MCVIDLHKYIFFDLFIVCTRLTQLRNNLFVLQNFADFVFSILTYYKIVVYNTLVTITKPTNNFLKKENLWADEAFLDFAGAFNSTTKITYKLISRRRIKC